MKKTNNELEPVAMLMSGLFVLSLIITVILLIVIFGLINMTEEVNIELLRNVFNGFIGSIAASLFFYALSWLFRRPYF